MSVLNKKLNLPLYEVFSNPFHPTVDDIVAVGGMLDVQILQYAYKQGVFPWPHEGYPLLWFAPEQRGVIDFQDLHLSKSFKKWLKKNEDKYTIKFNTVFSDVMKNCRQQKRKNQKGSWINQEIEQAYFQLHQQGKATSLEVYEKDLLVGGIYGVESELYFSCESMFHLQDNVSKLALIQLIKMLKEKGQNWMDIQMVTSVCESFGGKLISKDIFLKRLGF